MEHERPPSRAMTSVVGNILLVAVVVVIAITVAGLSFAFLEDTGTPTADASFDFEQTSAGLELVPKALGTDVIVKLNGQAVTTVAADSAGQSVLLPTAPGDTVTVVSTDEDRSVLLKEEIDDRSEVGDFVAYYTFEDSGNKDKLKDQSGNGNDGNIIGDPTWVTGGDSGLQFDGSNDYVEVNNIQSRTDVGEFTIAVAYKPETGDKKQELVEHINSDGSNWLLELKDDENQTTGQNEYELAYSVDKDSGSQTGQFFAGPYNAGERRVAVGTFDGTNYELFVDGNKEGTGSFDDSQTVGVGDLIIAKDGESGANRDFFDGEIYEIRLYYTAFDGEQVRVITEAMS